MRLILPTLKCECSLEQYSSQSLSEELGLLSTTILSLPRIHFQHAASQNGWQIHRRRKEHLCKIASRASAEYMFHYGARSKAT